MPCYELSAVLNEPGITMGDIFHFPGEMLRHPQTNEVLRYEKRFVMSRPMHDGLIEFWPARSDGVTSVSADDMEGAYCSIDAMKWFRAAWEAENPVPPPPPPRISEKGAFDFVEMCAKPRRWFVTPELLQWKIMQAHGSYEGPFCTWPTQPILPL